MEKAKLELAVGTFVLVGLLCLTYLSVKLGRLEVIGRRVYEIHAEFTSASGLRVGAAVEIAGVEIGRVKAVALKDDRASVSLAIQKDLKLYDGTIASIKTRGIIGEKFVALSPGGGGEVLGPGGTIRDTEAGLDLEEIIGQFIHGRVQ